MSAVARILFAVRDPAGRRQPGVAKAAALARRLGASLELFHALTSPVFLTIQALDGISLVDLERTEVERCVERLDKIAAGLRRSGVDVTTKAAWDRPPHEAILRRATRIGADLVIAEVHQGRRHPWLLRLTDWELLRASKLPVLLLRSARPWHRPRVLAAVDPGRRHAKPADLDARILAGAESLSTAFHGKLHVAHAFDPSTLMLAVANSAFSEAEWGDARAQLQSEDRKDFEKLLASTAIPASRRHLLIGAPAAQLPRLARQIRPSVLVIGTASRSALKRAFIGNTAERVLDEVPCDVLVVKPAVFGKRLRQAPRGMRVIAPAPLIPVSA